MTDAIGLNCGIQKTSKDKTSRSLLVAISTSGSTYDV